MPKDFERKLMKEARHKFHSTTSPRARAYIYGTMRKTGWTPARKITPKVIKPTIATKPVLILKGNRQYVNRMYKHLRAEHPSTRHRLKLFK